ncbi:hypothetical protein HW555_009037 [Spodoptera exigua]|uniref:FP protein C-terminal domain-containing protein n=1 Tax=Spodoptera exigua TaxID=7107 RepID=A0A835L274_SPOEX|nr:hypothetical protein HW555_009037 [Spodoptera exigua]
MADIIYIPKTEQRETSGDLINSIQKLGKILNIDIETSGIRDIYRVNTKTDNNKPIIVEFVSKLTKENIITAVKKFNSENRNNKLNTTHLQIKGPQNPIYVAETLTASARKLFYLSREFAKEHNYSFCWVANGRIFLRKAEGQKSTRVDSESDLNCSTVNQNHITFLGSVSNEDDNWFTISMKPNIGYQMKPLRNEMKARNIIHLIQFVPGFIIEL